MTLYSLTEAYSEIYDHRKVEDLFDNLRFVDYLQDEDIQEVVEELVWEFRDYGNTLEEAFEMIDYALEDTVICESYNQLVEDVLYEYTITKGKHRADFAGSAQGRVTTGKTHRFDPKEVERRAKRIGQVRSANRSVKSRLSKLSGPISSVQQAISGSAGGMGRAAKALGGKVVEKGKVMLKSLLRRGGKALTSAGQSIEGSGVRASQQAPKTKSVRVGKTTLTATKEPGGAKRQMVGSAVKRVGQALQRRGEVNKPNSSVRALPSRTSGSPATQRSSSKEPLLARDPSGNVINTNKTTKALPSATSGRPAVQRTSPGITTARGVRATARLKKAAVSPPSSGPVRALPPKGAGTFTPSGNIRSEAQRKYALSRAARQGKKALNREELDLLLQYISEDLIDAGYAYNIDEAYEIINDLDESTLTEIIYDYLEE